MKYLILVLALGFTGCVYTKNTTVVECIEGRVHLSTWRATVFDTSKDIRVPKYAVAQRHFVLTDSGKSIQCICPDEETK